MTATLRASSVFVILGAAAMLATRLHPPAPPAAPTLAAVVNAVPDAPAPRPTSVEEARRQARERSRPHLDGADRECTRALNRRLGSLDTFFGQAKKGAPGLADDVLGWGSKWRFVADRLPFTRVDRHETFLREKFEEHLFQADALETELRGVVRLFLQDVRAIENQMLVQIHLDLADLPPLLLVARIDQRALGDSFQSVMDRAAARTGAGLREDVAQQLVSIIVAEVATAGAVRLGVSAGVLGVGASSSWATLGVGLVVGLIIDQIVSWIWDWWADPRGNLAREVQAKLDELQQALTEGSATAPGLRPRLAQLARERSTARRAAILELIQRTGGER